VPYALPVPACRDRDAPLPPPGVKFGDAAWATWFSRELMPWVAEVEKACPMEPRINPAPADTSLIDAGLYGERVR